MSIQIVGGIPPQHYHTLPYPLDQLTIAPLKEHIFKMLNQISRQTFS